MIYMLNFAGWIKFFNYGVNYFVVKISIDAAVTFPITIQLGVSVYTRVCLHLHPRSNSGFYAYSFFLELSPPQ